MGKKWAQFVLAAVVAVTLVAAPCKACQPTETQKAPPSHDCCQKKSPEKKSPCSWQPSDLDALNPVKAQIQVELAVEPLSPVAPMAPIPALAPVAPVPAVPPLAAPPPLYLVNASFLI